jgi:hypothetical protein
MTARASGSDNLVETSSAAQVLFFDLDAAVATESLDYHEQLLAFVFEGLVNKAGAQSPTIQFNAAFMNFGLWYALHTPLELASHHDSYALRAG